MSDVDVALAVLDVVASGDPHAADHVLATDAVLWHNDGNGEAPAKDGFAGAEGLHAMVEDLRVERLLAEPLPGGAVLRFEVRGRVRSTGSDLCAHNCAFVTVTDGRITRVDEYVDPTFLAQLGL